MEEKKHSTAEQEPRSTLNFYTQKLASLCLNGSSYYGNVEESELIDLS